MTTSKESNGGIGYNGCKDTKDAPSNSPPLEMVKGALIPDRMVELDWVRAW